MVKKTSTNGASFVQACEHLGVSPDQLVSLRSQGLAACLVQGSKQIYPTAALDITRRLLQLGRERSWSWKTLAWYGDLVFATEVGRAILLPITSNQITSTHLPTSWLETQYTAVILDDLIAGVERPDGPLVTLLRSLVSAGASQFWPDIESVTNSALYPVITHLESAGIPILAQHHTVARDAGPILLSMLLTFIHVAPAISQELSELAHVAYDKLKEPIIAQADVSAKDQDVIARDGLVAVDKLYASKSTEIHSPPEIWDVRLGIITAQKRTITLEMKLHPESSGEIIDNIIDIIRPYVGPFGARVIHLLYETANDSPYWRNPLITVETNDLLDRLGVKRDKHGYHRSDSRERLRDALNAAHYLEIVGEYSTWENGKQVRKALRRTVLSLIGATFDAKENEGLSTADLFRQGLPKSLQIRLNFYDGVRKPDGRLGNQYVLVSRLPAPEMLPSARHAATEELLRAYLLVRYRQTRMESRTLTVTRSTALEKTNITTKHVTRATQILTRALDKLIADGTLEQYSPVPLKPHQSFTVTLASHNINDTQIHG